MVSRCADTFGCTPESAIGSTSIVSPSDTASLLKSATSGLSTAGSTPIGANACGRYDVADGVGANGEQKRQMVVGGRLGRGDGGIEPRPLR